MFAEGGAEAADAQRGIGTRRIDTEATDALQSALPVAQLLFT